MASRSSACDVELVYIFDYRPYDEREQHLPGLVQMIVRVQEAQETARAIRVGLGGFITSKL